MTDFRRHNLVAAIRVPDHDFAETKLRVEIREDPLTGHSARILRGTKLLPPSQLDLRALPRRRARAARSAAIDSRR